MRVRITETHIKGWDGVLVSTETTLRFFTERSQADRYVDLLKTGRPAASAAREAVR